MAFQALPTIGRALDSSLLSGQRNTIHLASGKMIVSPAPGSEEIELLWQASGPRCCGEYRQAAELDNPMTARNAEQACILCRVVVTPFTPEDIESIIAVVTIRATRNESVVPPFID